jgi:hypothetical protein
MKKSKFDLLYESIMDSCKKHIIKESKSALPIEVKDAIAKFIYDYLV